MTTIITTSAPTTTPDFGGYFYLDNKAWLDQFADFIKHTSAEDTDSLRDDWQSAVFAAIDLKDGEWIRLEIAKAN